MAQSGTTVLFVLLFTRVAISQPQALPSCDSFLRILFPNLFRHCTCTYSEWSQWQRVPSSDVNVTESTCNSGQAYSERRSKTASERRCDPKTETRQVCVLDLVDTLIYSLGLGSTGYDYTNFGSPTVIQRQGDLGTGQKTAPQGTPPPPSPPSNTRRRRQSPPSEYRCPEHGTNGWGWICERPSQGKRAVERKWLPPYSDHTRYRRQLPTPINCTRRSVLFVLDTSGSIGRESYKKMTAAVSRLVALFCAPTQFAVMTFGDLLRLEFCFNCFNNSINGRRAAAEAIYKTEYRHGPRTRTGEAVRCVCNELLDQYKCGLDPLSCIDVVFITDGLSNGALDVCREVQCLHTNRFRHINTYAIGINNYNEREIKCLSKYSNHEEVIFGFDSFDKFVGYLEDVIKRLTLSGNIGKYNCLNRNRNLNP